MSIGNREESARAKDFEAVEGAGTSSVVPPGERKEIERIVVRVMDILIEVARTPGRFHKILQDAFGVGHNKEIGERIRQDILGGDRSWMPVIDVASAEELGGAFGAYDQESGTVFLQKETLSIDGSVDVLIEEIGHHLDRTLNGTDSAGDEGEIFRRLMVGENLSDASLAALREEDDHGILWRGGDAVQVENWVARWLLDRLWKSKGVQETARATANRIVRTLTSAGERVNAATQGWADDLVRNAESYGKDLVRSCERISEGFAKLGRGDLGGLTDIGNGLLDSRFAHWHAFARLTLDTVSMVQTATGLEPIGRPLLADQIEKLRKIFGDAVDYSQVVIKEGDAGVFAGGRALTMGNKIYMKDNRSPHLLAHEMTHVWQFQNGGNDYMLKAGWAQFTNWIQDEDVYGWWRDIQRGWPALSPEQQAELIEDGSVYLERLEPWEREKAAYDAREVEFRRMYPSTAGRPGLGDPDDTFGFERREARRVLDAERMRLEGSKPEFRHEGTDYLAELHDALTRLRNRTGAP